MRTCALLVALGSIALVAPTAHAQSSIPVLLPDGFLTSSPYPTPAIVSSDGHMLSPPLAAPTRPARARVNVAPIVIGAIALGIGWLGGVAAGVAWHVASGCEISCPNAPSMVGPFISIIPIVGPWIALGTNDYRGDSAVLPVTAGLLEAAGLVTLIVGLAVPAGDSHATTMRLGPTGVELALRF